MQTFWILNSFEERSACHAPHNSFLKTTTGTYVRPNLEVDCPLSQREVDPFTWIDDNLNVCGMQVFLLSGRGSTPPNNVFASQKLGQALSALMQ